MSPESKPLGRVSQQSKVNLELEPVEDTLRREKREENLDKIKLVVEFFGKKFRNFVRVLDPDVENAPQPTENREINRRAGRTFLVGAAGVIMTAAALFGAEAIQEADLSGQKCESFEMSTFGSDSVDAASNLTELYADQGGSGTFDRALTLFENGEKVEVCGDPLLKLEEQIKNN